MTLSWSFLSCDSAILSCLFRLGLCAFPFLSNAFMLALSSEASSSLSLGYIDSIAVIYSRLGMLLGDMAKLGPLANKGFCAGVSLVLDKFMTPLLMSSSLAN